MSGVIRCFVGLDVHEESIAIGVAEAGREEPRFLGTVGPDPAELRKALKRIGPVAALLIVYEEGPSGYGLARDLSTGGYHYEAIASSKITRRPGDRIKTDRRVALLLVRMARSGELVQVVVPDERDEALRDLSRSRSDAVRARREARQKLEALLLWRGHCYSGKRSWTLARERVQRLTESLREQLAFLTAPEIFVASVIC